MTFDPDIWHAGLSSHCLCQIRRSRL